MRAWVGWFLLSLCVLFCLSASGAVFTVTTTNDIPAAGSLRWAISSANATNGKDWVQFSILPAGAQKTIQLTNPLPAIVEAIVIDGTTQSGNPCLPGIELNGRFMNPGGSGLWLMATNCEIRGLVINRCGQHGILIQDEGGNIIEGNYIGTDRTGSTAATNTLHGIRIESSPGNLIGRLPANDCSRRNIISGNRWSGISIVDAGSKSNLVRNNYIGLDVNGSSAIPNRRHGVEIDGASRNVIGDDSTPHPINIISGNATNGILLTGTDAERILILGNYIGTDVGGTVNLPNGGDGVHIHDADRNQIGRGADGRNIISGNGDDGIEVWGSGSFSTVILGNLIGVDISGTVGMGNGDDGIIFTNAVPSSYIGGTNSYDRNIIGDNGGCGIALVAQCKANWVLGNYIGLQENGLFASPNMENGVLIYAYCTNNVIGDHHAGAGNVVSGNGSSLIHSGVLIAEGSVDNDVRNNIIGLNAYNNVLGNAGDGINIYNAHSNTIGWQTANMGNVISGNSGDGIQIGWGSTGNRVYQNLIGLDTNGASARPNGGEGVFIFRSFGNDIGGNLAGHRNVISGNTGSGIKISDSSASHDNSILSNFIGTDGSGSNRIGNSDAGVLILNAPSNTVGAANDRNVISGNVGSGLSIEGTNSVGNRVVANDIGVDQSGTLSVSNGQYGIYILDAVDTLIGGDESTERNIISGNGIDGIYVTGARDTRVSGNHIGTGDAGTESLGNQRNGIWIGDSASGNTIGGTNAGEGNAIHHNGVIGVRVHTGTNNAILGNSIYFNFGLGIDVGGLAVTDNDDGDADSGANNLQNFPVLFSAGQGSINVGGTLNSLPGTTYRIEFFLNDAADFTGYGEGQTYLGFTDVTTDGSGNVDYEVSFAGDATTSQYVSATATDPWGNTSEFGLSKKVVEAPQYDGDGDGIPFFWEDRHSLDPHSRTGNDGADGDPDLDRMDNWSEYVSDTNPQDGNDYQRFTVAEKLGPAIALEHSSTNSRYYMIHYTDDLTSTQLWTELYTPALQGWNNTNRTSRYDVNLGPGRRAYRVQVQFTP